MWWMAIGLVKRRDRKCELEFDNLLARSVLESQVDVNWWGMQRGASEWGNLVCLDRKSLCWTFWGEKRENCQPAGDDWVSESWASSDWNWTCHDVSLMLLDVGLISFFNSAKSWCSCILSEAKDSQNSAHSDHFLLHLHTQKLPSLLLSPEKSRRRATTAILKNLFPLPFEGRLKPFFCVRQQRSWIFSSCLLPSAKWNFFHIYACKNQTFFPSTSFTFL